MALIDVQRRVREVCLGPEPEAAALAPLGDERVWRIYRKMVRNRLRGELKAAFRRSYAALGREAFERAFERYLQLDPPRTRRFYELPSVFAASAVDAIRTDPSVPPFAADLLAFEAAVRIVGDLPDHVQGDVGEFAFERRAVLSPALRLLALEYAVNERPAADGSHARVPTYLCVQRRPEEKKARVWKLNAVMHALMQRFERHDEPVRDAIAQVAHERQIVVDATFLDGLCTVLADFIERGVLLGCRP